MDPLTCWAIRPEVLRAIRLAVTNGPSTEVCARAEQMLGRSTDTAELRSMLLEEMAGGSPALSEDAQAALASRRSAPQTSGGVAVIPLQGIIRPSASLLAMIFGLSSGGLEVFKSQVKAALDNDDVGSILINVDSPGGYIDQVPETAAFIREAAKVKPVRAIANTDAGSAAYWLASQADELSVTDSGQVGSIGVFVVHEDWSGFNEKFGVDPTYISAGKYKTEGNPDEPLSDEAREALQERIDTWYAMFVSDVAKGRGVTASTVKKGFGEGRMVLAGAAVSEGMADRVESFESMRARLTGAKRRQAKAEEVDPSAAQASAEETDESVTDASTDRDRLIAVRLGARPRRM